MYLWRGKKAPLLLISISLVILIIATAFLAACSSSTTTQTTTATTTSTQTTTAAPQPVTLVFSSFEPADSYHSTDVYIPLFNEIEKRTSGRVKIEPHYNGELVGLMDTYDAVIKGTIDMGLIAPQHVIGKFPMHDVFALCPMDAMGWRPARVQLDLYNQFPAVKAQFDGVKPVVFSGPFVSFAGTAKKPLRKLEDGKGLKMVMAGAVAAERAKGLGWVPVDAIPPETYGMWQTGVADGGGVINPGDLIVGFRWGEVIKYITMVPMNRYITSVIMNEDKFNSLSADDQKVIDDLLPWVVDLSDKVETLQYKKAMDVATKDFGDEFIQLSSEEIARWVAADKPTVDAWTASLESQGLPGTQYYQAYRELEKKYTAAEYEFK